MPGDLLIKQATLLSGNRIVNQSQKFLPSKIHLLSFYISLSLFGGGGGGENCRDKRTAGIRELPGLRTSMLKFGVIQYTKNNY